MALSNSQYDHLMRTYEQKQLDNEFQLRKRYEKAYALIPELEERTLRQKAGFIKSTWSSCQLP